MGTLALILIPAVLFAGAVVAFLVLRERTELRQRPWWGVVPTWLIVCGVLLVLGLVVAPRLLGFTFLLLPFIWVAGLGRRRERRE
jgi:dolichyl-phosphate-mannose--protein O-mannosyl transferase